jgi:uncharacterized protein (DUF1800 family)
MKISRRQFVKAGSAALLATTAGCEQAANFLGIGATKHELAGPLDPPQSDSLDDVSHALNRLTFGPRPGDYARARALGVAAFIDEQLSPEKIDDAICDNALRRFEALTEPAGEMFEYRERFLLDQMTRATILRATLSQRQLYEVMVRFWSDHFNIDPSKGDCKWLKAADDRDVVRAHALGRFSDLLRASALSPAMLWYLDGRVNRRARPDEKPNENYARELLELHTLGVHGGYTQRDVMEVARCLTGWTVRGTKQSKFGLGAVEFQPRLHDNGEKTVLGQFVAPGGRERDLDRVLEIIALHPSTARHLAEKLCRHFIADDPPQGAVASVADAFLKNAGDIRATLRALFSTAEFADARGAKFKRPFEFVVSALRTTNADTDAGPPLVDYLLRMGHAPFRYPTPDGYPEAATHWMGTLLWRWNFAVALCENRIPRTRVHMRELREKLGGDDALAAHVLGRKPTTDESRACRESEAGLALLLASPAFQRC